MDLTLYFAPDTCARVTMIALEEASAHYEAKLISFARGNHRSDWFRALNPRGRVPTLIVDGVALTENMAILHWLSRARPAAQLLPAAPDPLREAQILADFAWCASGLHPIVTRMRLPHFFCDLADAAGNVRGLAEAAIRAEFTRIEQRLSEGPWWYGEHWSILDAYINWVWFRVTGCGLNASDFPRLQNHDQRLQERPSVRKVLNLHAESARELAEQGLAVNFDTIASQISQRKVA